MSATKTRQQVDNALVRAPAGDQDGGAGEMLWTISDLPLPVSALDVAVDGTVVIAVGRGLPEAPQTIAAATDGSTLTLPTAEEAARRWRERRTDFAFQRELTAVAVGAGRLYVMEQGRGVVVAQRTPGGCLPRADTFEFAGATSNCLLGTPAGVWLGGGTGAGGAAGVVGLWADGQPLTVVGTGLEQFVHRLGHLDDDVLACSGRSLYLVTPTGATLLKRFARQVLDAAGHGKVIVVLTDSGLQFSKDGGKTWKATLKFDRKCYPGERGGIAFGHGCFVAMATNDRVGVGRHLVFSDDGVTWTPVPGGDFGIVNLVRVSPTGFVVGGTQPGRFNQTVFAVSREHPVA